MDDKEYVRAFYLSFVIPLFSGKPFCSVAMRSSRGGNGSSRGGGIHATTGYSSSDDDERARLKPQLKTAPGITKPGLGSRQYSGATSPNESDNTYAEAVLLTGSNSGGGVGGNRYEQGAYYLK